MRTVFITRKTLTDSDTYFIMLDGANPVEITDTSVYRFIIDDNAHEINTYCSGGPGNVCTIPEGNTVAIFDVSRNSGNSTYDLTPDPDAIIEEPVHVIVNQRINDSTDSEKSITTSIVSAVIVGLCMCGVCLLVFLFGQTSLIGFIAGIVCVISGSICTIIGGHWIIIIPLPFVFIWKYGCVHKNQSTLRSVLTGIFAVLLPLTGILSMFLLAGV